MERVSTVSPDVRSRRSQSHGARVAPPTSTASSLWITTSTLVFDESWRITYASHTENASPSITQVPSEGQDVMALLSDLCPQLQQLEKDSVVQEKGPFSSQFGLWDQNAYRNYRLHLYANAAGGLCRIETRIPQPERVTQHSITTPPKSRDSLDKNSIVPKTTHDWIGAIDERWPAVAFVQAPDHSIVMASESLFQFTGRSPEEFSNDPELFWKTVYDSDRSDLKKGPPKHDKKTRY